jgi:large subunit ribosomal protein L13
MAKPGEIKREWFVIDATGKPLGRLASEVARILRGKNKPVFTPHVDTGDHVIIINAEKVILTGNKPETKVNYRHSGYIGGLTVTKYSDLLRSKPERAIEMAVKGMLPHTTLGRSMGMKMKVYRGPNHPHEAQQPKVLELTNITD